MPKLIRIVLGIRSTPRGQHLGQVPPVVKTVGQFTKAAPLATLPSYRESLPSRRTNSKSMVITV